MHIDPDTYYPPAAPEMEPIAAKQTLARWRHEGRGPAYIKSGSRVIYLGQDVLDWLYQRRGKNRVAGRGCPRHRRDCALASRSLQSVAAWPN